MRSKLPPILFTVSLAGAVGLNALHLSPETLMLSVAPVIAFAMMVRSPYTAAAFAAGIAVICLSLMPDWAWYSAFPFLILPPVALLVQRVTRIASESHRQKVEHDELFMSTMLSLSKSIDARDPYTAFHSRNVAGYARSIAEELGLSSEQTEAIYLAGLIHDIGKIGTPEPILQKEGGLSNEEYETMKRHAEDGYGIIKDIKKLQKMGVTEMVRHHHERIDGRGYPLGLKGEHIPLGARILGVCDAYDAMTTNRSYRQKLTEGIAAGELQRHAGQQFDDQIVAAFLKVLRREGKLELDREAVYVPMPVRKTS